MNRIHLPRCRCSERAAYYARDAPGAYWCQRCVEFSEGRLWGLYREGFLGWVLWHAVYPLWVGPRVRIAPSQDVEKS